MATKVGPFQRVDLDQMKKDEEDQAGERLTDTIEKSYNTRRKTKFDQKRQRMMKEKETNIGKDGREGMSAKQIEEEGKMQRMFEMLLQWQAAEEERRINEVEMEKKKQRRKAKEAKSQQEKTEEEERREKEMEEKKREEEEMRLRDNETSLNSIY